MVPVQVVDLSEHEWKVLLALKREFSPEEIQPTPWAARAEEAGISLDEFYHVAEQLNARGVIGRFSTFLEHVKPSTGGYGSRDSTRFFTGPCRRVAKSKRAAKSGGTIF